MSNCLWSHSRASHECFIRYGNIQDSSRHLSAKYSSAALQYSILYRDATCVLWLKESLGGESSFIPNKMMAPHHYLS